MKNYKISFRINLDVGIQFYKEFYTWNIKLKQTKHNRFDLKEIEWYDNKRNKPFEPSVDNPDALHDSKIAIYNSNKN